MRTASVVVGALMCPVSGSITRMSPAKANNLREALGGLSSDGMSSTEMAKSFMGDLARKVAMDSYNTTDVDLNAVKSIKDFISGIEAQAMEHHDEDVKLLQSAIDQINKCGLIPQQTRDAHSKTKQDCKNKGEQHDKCRVVESRLHAEMSDECKAYRKYRMHDVKKMSDDCMPKHMLAVDISADRATKPRALKNMEGCLVHSVEWLFPLHELYLKCKLGKGEHHKRRKNCTAEQEEFEQCVCDYRGHMVSGCEAHEDCYEEKVKEHGAIETQVKTREPTRKADHVAGEKIKCYFRVLTVSQAEKKTILADCEGLAPNTSQFDIAYPVVPAIETCPLPPSPCNNGWRNKNYLSSPWYTGAPASQCHECSAGARAKKGPCECYDPEQAARCNLDFAEDFLKAGTQGSRCHESADGKTKFCYFSLDCDMTGSHLSTSKKCKYKHGMSEAECAYDASEA